MSVVLALVRAMRPHQWAKNLFVFAPLLFEHRFDDREKGLRVVVAFAIFCCVASGIYLLNDVLDREADRRHPEKRRRPVASGALSVPLALAAAATLLGGGLLAAFAAIGGVPFVSTLVAYVAIQFAYSLGLKRLVIVDVMCIASGFVLRLLAGCAAGKILPSPWILVCTIFLSLFLALCKRRQEVRSLGEGAAAHRPILAHYPEHLLDQLIGAAASGTLITYALYTVDKDTVAFHKLLYRGTPQPVLVATVPFVIYGVFRYLYLVYRREEGGSPTVTLFRDVPTLVNGALYLAAVAAIFAAFR